MKHILDGTTRALGVGAIIVLALFCVGTKGKYIKEEEALADDIIIVIKNPYKIPEIFEEAKSLTKSLIGQVFNKGQELPKAHNLAEEKALISIAETAIRKSIDLSIYQIKLQKQNATTFEDLSVAMRDQAEKERKRWAEKGIVISAIVIQEIADQEVKSYLSPVLAQSSK